MTESLKRATDYFAETIRTWFLQNGRKLPWRNKPSAYEVWVSEIMLQQTQVSTVIPYYERWLSRFPDIQTLAAADSDEVLRHWAGLGYYRRARYLHEGAKVIVKQYGGDFPQSIQELRKIPGIGAYTAGAIASFAFKQNVPAIDGNAERVLSRFFGISGILSEREPRKQLEQCASLITEYGHANDTNQAIMDLGAGCCSKTPSCESCPLAARCYALKNGLTTALPYKKQRIEKYDDFRAALKLELPDKRVLIARKAQNSLLGGLWEYPMLEISRGKGETHKKSAEMKMRLPRQIAWKAYLNDLFPQSDAFQLSGWLFSTKQVSHTFTHIEMRAFLDTVHCEEMPILPAEYGDYDAFTFALEDEIGSKYAISTLMKKILD